MKLKALLAEVPHEGIRGEADPEISAVTYDSRQVTPGSLFVAVRGLRADGHAYLDEAEAAGAAAALVEEYSPAELALAQVLVADSRRAMAQAAAVFYGHPGREIPVIGVTGTNGKTTVSFLLEAIFHAAGKKTALMTTVKNALGGEDRPARLTTGEAPEVQALLREAADAGAAVAVVEVSSHALTLSRVAGMPFAAAVFTNLSHDHLDLHGDMDSYFAAKASLFEELAPASPAIINADDPYGRKLAARSSGRVVTYGVDAKDADYRAEGVSAGWSGSTFTVAAPDGSATAITSPLAGSFNVGNCLAAFAAARELGVPAEAAAKGLAETAAVPGRLEAVAVNDDLRVVIDYAHSPDSMEKVLGEIRRLPEHRLVVVFGCTGDRDVEKRPTMGEIAGRYGDYVVVTTDDPYYEDPAAIARGVEEGLRAAGAADEYTVILDRSEAVRHALASARPGEPTVIALLGKGHEDIQKVRGRNVPYNDRKTVERLAEELGLTDRGRVE
ncbi:MAG: UDP-N-acetylmuramoyl-L-alanyl-D-glutamate--2,6-diaminopimelate ligase [Candidatus Zixiibacteriota bacterium]